MDYSMRNIYPNFTVNPSVNENTVPDSNDQAALANADTTAPTAKHGSILTWLGIGVLFIVLFQIGGK